MVLGTEDNCEKSEDLRITHGIFVLLEFIF